MRKIFVFLLLALSVIMPASAAVTEDSISDRITIKELVDTFSNLADTMELEAQSELFAEDGTLTAIAGGVTSEPMVGRKEILESCEGYMSQFTDSFHMNGQLVISDLDEDSASGTAYCVVYLLSEDGTMTVRGVRYADTYSKIDGEWKIQDRTSNFIFTYTIQL